jgi:hypothetical protein
MMNMKLVTKRMRKKKGEYPSAMKDPPETRNSANNSAAFWTLDWTKPDSISLGINPITAYYSPPSIIKRNTALDTSQCKEMLIAIIGML